MVEIVLSYLVAILALYFQTMDFISYRKFRKKKFNDSVIWLLVFVYVLAFTILNLSQMPFHLFIVIVIYGQGLFLYVGLSAIQRRELNFLWGGNAKGEGIKWIGVFWIIVSIIWLMIW